MVSPSLKFRSTSLLDKLSKSSLCFLDKLGSEWTHKVNLIKNTNQLAPLSEPERTIVKTIKREGICVTSLDALSLPSTPLLLESANKILPTLSKTQKCHDDRSHHSHIIGTKGDQIARDYPDLVLWGLEERLLNIAENYVGLPLAYHGVAFRKDIPNGKQVGTRLWHKDGEDRRVFKVIVYLTDVNEKDGPFEYIPKSLTPSYRSFQHIHCKILDDDMNKVVPTSQWKACTGAAGTVLLVDTASIFHHGKVPESERVTLIFTYTSRQPKQPDICHKHHFSTDKLLQLLQLTRSVSQRQKECILWNR